MGVGHNVSVIELRVLFAYGNMEIKMRKEIANGK